MEASAGAKEFIYLHSLFSWLKWEYLPEAGTAGNEPTRSLSGGFGQVGFQAPVVADPRSRHPSTVPSAGTEPGPGVGRCRRRGGGKSNSDNQVHSRPKRVTERFSGL